MLQYPQRGECMLLVNKLRNSEGFSQIEKRLAQYVLNHPQEVMQMSIEEFSQTNYVSNSSVVRFTQKLGFKGYPDFKINLASELHTFTLQNERIQVDMPFSQEDSMGDLPKIFLNLYHQSLTDIYPHIDMEKIEHIAHLLDEATLISCLAQGPSLALAMDFHYKLKRIAYPSLIEPLMGFESVSPSKRSEREVVLIISSYGISDSIKDWLKYHRLVGNKTIFITLNQSSPYIALADVSMVLDTFEKRLFKLGHFASKTAMMYILDLIYASLFKLNYDDNVNKLLAHRNVLADEED